MNQEYPMGSITRWTKNEVHDVSVGRRHPHIIVLFQLFYIEPKPLVKLDCKLVINLHGKLCAIQNTSF